MTSKHCLEFHKFYLEDDASATTLISLHETIREAIDNVEKLFETHSIKIKNYIKNTSTEYDREFGNTYKVHSIVFEFHTVDELIMAKLLLK